MLTGDLVDVNVAPLFSAPAQHAQFSVRGRAARIEGEQRRGVHSVTIGGRAALTDFTAHLPPADRITVTPVYTDRLLGDWGCERSFVPSKLPSALLQWQPAQTQTLELSWSVSGVVLNESAQQLVIGGPPDIAFSTSAPVDWSIESQGDQLRVRLRTVIGAGERFVLGASAAGADSAAPALVRTRAADWQRLLKSSPMVELDGTADPNWLRALHQADDEALAALLRLWVEFEPDPERERVVLRPIVKAEHPRVAVRRLDLGGAWLDVEWTLAGRRVVFDLTLSYGNLNPRVILEAKVPGQVDAARVDGQPAQLSLREEDGWTICPVQLVLDHPRRIEIELK